MSEWKTYKLGDVVDMRNGKKRPKEAGKFPVYGGNGILDYTNQYNAENVIVVGRVGAYCGSVYRCKQKCWVSDNAICVNSKPIIDDNFLFYLMSSLDFHHFHIGGAQPLMTQDIIGSFEISIPSLAEQKRIADILSAIDDKIELNRRINANLEQQAQALYKSWFVDFEPFGGKMPEDWRVGRLGEIAEFRRGKGILGKDTIKGNIPVVAGGLEPAYYHNLANTKAPVVTISASGANAGFMRMYNVDVWASDCSYIDSRCANLLWTYCYLKINAQLLKHAQTGAVQPHVKASDVNAFEIIIPSSENILNFQQKVKPIFDQIANNERENIHLAQLRDTLLPKLMSGEINV